MEEVWKEVPSYPKYEASNLGNIRNKETRRLKQKQFDRSGSYYQVWVTDGNKDNTRYVHRMVAEAFYGEHPGMVVNHIDGDKFNNKADNLEWCTTKENNIHAIKNGLNHPGAYQKRPIRVLETGEIFDGVVECANAIGGDFRNVYRSLNGDKHYPVNGLHFEYVKPKESSKPPFLYPYQMDAVNHLRNGSILNGGVGSGKSRTSLYYYFKEQGGSIDPDYIPMKNPRDLYIITTARKRDMGEWEKELVPFLMYGQNEENRLYSNKVVIDSWNNIKKYGNVYGAFFIFDEQRVCGTGAWVKTFLNIARKNKWILLSATPGDKWEDYRPVFQANGFYKTKTEFQREHLRYDPYCKNYPRVIGYMNEERLRQYRDQILVDMDFNRKTIHHHEDVYVKYDIPLYKEVGKERKNPYKTVEWEDGSVHQAPIVNAADLCYTWRRVVNSDESRQIALLELLEDHPKAIIFYSYDYERDILLNLGYGEDVAVAEWNGHKHQLIPKTEKWVYLVQYTSGCEGWNCIETDTIIFFSQQYSYKVLEQARGRIDRVNTPFTDLYYYYLKSRSGIDLAISNALAKKKDFNEGKWIGKW